MGKGGENLLGFGQIKNTWKFSVGKENAYDNWGEIRADKLY